MSNAKEAVIIMAKCTQHHRAYGMRTEKMDPNGWRITWAFPIKEASAKREGYDKTTIKGNVQFDGEYPGCPYCGKTQVTVCECGHLNCTHLQNGIFICAWCGMKGYIGEYTGQAIQAGIDA